MTDTATLDAAFPLLATHGQPRFAQIRTDDIVPAVTAAIADHQAAMTACVARAGDPAMLAFKEEADRRISEAWGVVGHLLAVTNTPELRAAQAQAQPLIAAHFAAVGQDRALYEAIRAIDPAALDPLAARARELALRDFELSGVALDGDDARDFAENQVEQGRVATEYANAVMDATEAWSLHVTDASRLAGIPEADLAGMAAAARAKGHDEGWLITLHAPVVVAVLTYAQDRALRHEVQQAYATRASDQGPNAGEFDNGPRMAALLALRAKAAQLLGQGDAASLSLATKMAESPDAVEAFLTDLAARTRPLAQAELADLAEFARSELGIETLEPWDMGFATERARLARHALDQSEVRRYLPLDRVLPALFGHVERLFGVVFKEVPGSGLWHDDVRQFDLFRAGADAPFARLYADFFAREGKRGGAWMNVCRSPSRAADGAQMPVAYLITNFAQAAPGKPALLQHADVVTLFHEMGHCLHHLLGEGDIPSIGGISGVEWDAVELPSQFLENFAYDPAVLKAASAHEETGEPLPDALIERLNAARGFMGALAVLRQIEFALFDIRLHRAAADAPDVQGLLDAVRAEVAVMRYPAWNRFAHAFSHIFAGGYAAGYYSYLWAELLSSDAYEQFAAAPERQAELGSAFRREVLSQGGGRPAMDNYVAFRGGAPDPGALLRVRGLAA
ncbi:MULTISPECIES: M3 family metallopeptidase [unclassified Novosphingobium]|uniref:M3 family metallopeptidase n=1 Tax=unclassified Novosphingobium TaxID=2644732 RepID=UPI000D2F8A12|nr:MULTISPECIES: M3 family metallopeptidase [unclassified Novosphingobium]PTR11859.1 oligopeptidase A [Novosphingobium sp. GV055]PUB04899.1 oligopeptidase A [Novosphingobium sp. GV061]PUB21218.1 oligopeptidase A [Novosphingobium sp. GV079]PUB42944.1 oligopeptidase A [Novosphingobium sp. GV027]